MEEDRPMKPNLNMAVIGDAYSGKSTLVGHLLVLLGQVSKEELHKVEVEAISKAENTAKYRWIVDKSKEERARGISIFQHYSKVQTANHHITVIDTPGDASFFKNTAIGISQADSALLLLDFTPEVFEKSISNEGSIRNKTIAPFIFGIRNLIVCVNKVDNETVSNPEERFENIKAQMEEFLKKVGYNPTHISFIPISAWEGHNLQQKSAKTPWYKGPTLIEAIEALKVPKRAVEKPLRIVVQDSFEIANVGTVGRGKVESGSLKPNTQVLIAPLQQTATIQSIEIDFKKVNKALDGDLISFKMNGIKASELKRGCIIGQFDSNPPKIVQEFTAQIVVMDAVGDIANGYAPVLHIHTTSQQCKITEIIKTIDKQKGNTIEEKPKNLKKEDCAIVTMRPYKPLSCEVFSEYGRLGRFLATDMKKIVLVGVVKTIKFVGQK